MNNELIQSGIITEVHGPQCMSYILNDSSLFALGSYKVLKNQDKSHFIRVAKLRYNGKIKLTYFTGEMISLKSILPSLSCDSFIIVLANLMSSVIDIIHNGFLDASNLNLKFNRIYVHPNTLAVSFIYLPIYKNRAVTGTVVLSTPVESELRADLIQLITATPSLATKRMKGICGWLSDGMLTFEDVYQKISMKPFENTNSRGDYHSVQPEMTISALNAPGNVTLRVNCPEYLIGKNEKAVNGCLSFNGAISRVHCKITWNGGAYYVEDMESMNGTYVNRKRLKPHQPQILTDGAVLSLANSDFIVHL